MEREEYYRSKKKKQTGEYIKSEGENGAVYMHARRRMNEYKRIYNKKKYDRVCVREREREREFCEILRVALNIVRLMRTKIRKKKDKDIINVTHRCT